MAETPKFKQGDWLRWQGEDGLVIGVVQYVSAPTNRFPYEWEYTTDQGTVFQSAVLECRPAPGDLTK